MSSSNRTLTKNHIVRTLADKHRLQIASARRVVQGTLDMILESLLRGNRVELRNFGVFEVVERAPRIARNPKATAQEVYIPKRKVVKFTQGKIMEEKITAPSMRGGIQPVRRSKPPESGTQDTQSDESPRTPGQTNP
ncbi:MAG: HU family DNA-binding protein [Planctomycetes bacterium]|nr:HU family DNA-binding protein [Planctomycetota bacterium]